MTLATSTRAQGAAEENARVQRAAVYARRGGRQTAPRSPFSNAVARMTHDIRTPLNAVIGFADLMQREFHGALGSDRYREYVGHIAECGARLLSVTEQTLLLAASAGGEAPPRPEVVSLSSLVAMAVRTVETGGMGHRLDVRCEISPDCDVSLDLAATRYAIANLIAAAARVACTGQILTIRVAEHRSLLALDLELSAGSDGTSCAADMSMADGHLGIARALLKLQGLELSFGHARICPWSARITFEDTAQLQLL